MNKCRGNADIPYMGIARQDKNNKIFVSKTTAINLCLTKRTSDFSTIEGGTARFEQFNRPTDMMNCPEPLCNTTGTLFVTQNVSTAPAKLTYLTDDNASAYVNGVISYYVVVPDDQYKYIVKSTVTDGTGANVLEFTDVIDNTNGAKSGQTLLIQHAFDESAVMLPSSDNGMVITLSVEVENADEETNIADEFGFSSLSLAQDKSAFEQFSTVVLTCLDEIDLPMELDLTDPTCLGQSYDPDSVSLELSVTAQLVSGNYMALNPFLHKTNETHAMVPTIEKNTIGVVTVNGVTLHGVKLVNYSKEECHFLKAMLPSCDAIEGELTYSSLNNLMEPAYDTFKIVTDDVTGDVYAVFNGAHIGLEVTITYPKDVRANISDATDDFNDLDRNRLVLPFTFKNGMHGYIISENAYVTSFPWGSSRTEDTPLEFTFTLAKENGRFFRFVEILDN